MIRSLYVFTTALTFGALFLSPALTATLQAGPADNPVIGGMRSPTGLALPLHKTDLYPDSPDSQRRQVMDDGQLWLTPRLLMRHRGEAVQPLRSSEIQDAGEPVVSAGVEQSAPQGAQPEPGHDPSAASTHSLSDDHVIGGLCAPGCGCLAIHRSDLYPDSPSTLHPQVLDDGRLSLFPKLINHREQSTAPARESRQLSQAELSQR